MNNIPQIKVRKPVNWEAIEQARCSGCGKTLKARYNAVYGLYKIIECPFCNTMVRLESLSDGSPNPLPMDIIGMIKSILGIN